MTTARCPYGKPHVAGPCVWCQRDHYREEVRRLQAELARLTGPQPMQDPPRTLDEARARTYGGRHYQEGRCAYEVQGRATGEGSHQCRRYARLGPDGLYCRRHAELVGEGQ